MYRARVYGRNNFGIVARRDIKKIRLWCDLNDDHAGIDRSFEAKLRMEF